MSGSTQQQYPTRGKGKVALSLAPLLVLVLAAAFVFLYGLGARPLEDWDEAIYAQVAKEIARGGDWLTLHWEYQNWFEKPPLLMWTTAIFYRLFGVTEFWSRAASALSGIGTVALVYLLGKRLYKDERTGLIAGLILLTSYHFVSFSRFGTTDVMLTFFTYLAIYAFVRQREGGHVWWYVVWSACALAVMSKGAGGWIAPAAIIISLAFEGRRSGALRTRHFWLALLLTVLIVAPWHALMYLRHGQTFLDEYVGYHVFARVRTPLEGHATNYFFYIGKIVDGFFPWCLLLPFAVVSSIRENIWGETRSRILLLLVALVVIVYTLVQSKLVWYIVPAYPALALLVAAFLRKIYLSAHNRRKLKFALTALGVLLVLAGGVYSFLLIRLTHRPEESLAGIAALAASRSANDREPLLLFSDTEALTRPAALFYSDRPLRQVYLTNEPHSPRARRYETVEKLESVVSSSSPARIVLRREDLEKLSAAYDVKVEAEADPFIYALIKRRTVGRAQ
ncbi:MAG TPA: glycosyltransferase family 39 protein [Pyrinomonadaceae bacterium]|nr:glycosyltransferase family 39 protein [Pyrinomonadaceae bacterium]